MKINLKKTHPILNLMNNSLINLPCPSSISYMWNWGSMAGFCLITQILTGLFLSMHYSSDLSLAFESVSHISRDTNNGWIMRFIHANGASMFFVTIYLHIGRNIYYESYKYLMTWLSGVLILFLTMATAFLGYVLPWGQMSFWGATVITNLLSAIPYLGNTMVEWVWGGFAVSNPTLTRFFSLHFILPFLILSFVLIHLIFLHETGSSNPLGTNTNSDKIPFHPFFTLKDLLTIMMLLMMILSIAYYSPNILTDPENFTPANPLVTPIHIQPEWYFLFAYAILRSIPNKLGGVMALFLSIMILAMIPPINNQMFKGLQFYPINQIMFWMFVNLVILLTWLGAQPVEFPFIIHSQLITILYFLYFIASPIMKLTQDYM